MHLLLIIFPIFDVVDQKKTQSNYFKMFRLK